MTDEELKKIIKEYQAELAELEETRARNAKRRANMTEEEFIKDLTAEYEAVLEDAKKNGMKIVTVPTDEEP
jgi:hypothetical protein